MWFYHRSFVRSFSLTVVKSGNENQYDVKQRGRYGWSDSEWLAQFGMKKKYYYMLRRNKWFVGGFNQTEFMTFSSTQNRSILITPWNACWGGGGSFDRHFIWFDLVPYCFPLMAFSLLFLAHIKAKGVFFILSFFF